MNYKLGLLVFLLGLFVQAGNAQCSLEGSVFNLIKICTDDFSGGLIATPDDNCPSGSISVILDNNCKGSVNASVYATNIASGNLVKGETYELPFTYPDFYLRHEYSPGNWVVTGPYTTFTYYGKHGGANGVSADIFYFNASLSTQLSNVDACDPKLPSTNVVTYEMGLELLELDRGYQPYPVGNYTGANDIFSCHVFYDTYCYCNDHTNGNHPLTNTPCSEIDDSPVVTSFVLDICVDCGTCFNQTAEDRSESDADRISSNSSASLQITPNPFSEEVNLSYAATYPAKMSLQIFNAQGQLIRQESKKVGAGNHQHTIPTAGLAQGVYYFHLRCGDHQISQKMFKLN